MKRQEKNHIFVSALPMAIDFKLILMVAYMVCLPLGGFSVINIGSRGVQPSWAVGFLMTGLYLSKVFCGRKCIKNDGIIITIFFVLFAVFISVFNPASSGNSEYFFDFLSTFSSFSLCIIVFLSISSYDFSFSSLKKLIKWYILISGFIAALGVLQFAFSYFGEPIEVAFSNKSWNHYGQRHGYEAALGGIRRSAALFREPRQLGAYLIGSIVLLMYCFISQRKIFSPSIHILLFIVIILGFLTTLSLSAFFMCGVCLIILFTINLKKFKSVAVILFLVMTGIGIFIALFQFTSIGDLPYWKRFNLPDFGYLYKVFIELPYRDDAYGYAHYVGNISYAFHIFMEHPFFGVGLNNLGNFPLKGYSGAHQPWRLFAECGLIGVTAIVVFLGFFLYQIQRMKSVLKGYNIRKPDFFFILDISAIFVILSPLKGLGSLYSFYNNFFWFDMSMAAILYFNVKKFVNKEKFYGESLIE